MKTILTLLIILETLVLQAQAFSWADQLGGSMADRINAMITDASGNIYVTGQFAGTMDADPGPGVLNITSAGGNDIFIVKVDVSGNLVWAKQIGGTLYGEEGSSLAVGASGDLYITGTFNGTVDFDPNAGEYLMTAHPPAYESCTQVSDVFILKLTSASDFVWARQVGGNGLDRSRAIALTPEEDIVVAGEYSSEGNFPVDLDPTEGTNYVTAVSGAAAFMIKLDPDGAFTWAKQWYSWGVFAAGCGFRDGLMHPLSLCIDGDGNIHCTGDFASRVDFDPDQGVFSILTQSNAAFVMKLNSDGGFQWASALNNAGSHAYGKDVVVGSNGHVYTVGTFDGTVDFDPGTGTKNLKAPGGSSGSIGPADAYVWVLNSLGNYVWAGQMGGNTDDAARSVDLDGAGNIYVTGTFTGTADFNPGTAKNTLKSAGGTDIFIAKLTSPGSYVWAVRIGGTSGEYVHALDVDATGAIITSGVFQGTADFNPSSGTYPLTSLGGDDAFVLKLTQSGPAFIPPALPEDPEVVSVSIFPNPTTGNASVVLPQYSESVSIRIYNLSGQLMYEQATAGYEIPLDMTAYRPGMYVVQVFDGHTTNIQKIIRSE